jgi:hypothetical protein
VEAWEDVKFGRVPCRGVHNFAKEGVLENDLFREEGSEELDEVVP